MFSKLKKPNGQFPDVDLPTPTMDPDALVLGYSIHLPLNYISKLQCHCCVSGDSDN